MRLQTPTRLAQVAYMGGDLGVVTGTDPAAGVEISETVPANERWLIHSIFFQLTTDATVANRRTRLRVDDGTNQVSRYISSANQIASDTQFYTFGPALGTTGVASGVNLIPANNIVLLGPGFNLITVTSNFQAGDDYGAPNILRERFFV